MAHFQQMPGGQIAPPSVIEIYMGPALYHITAGAHYGGGVGEAVLKSLQVRLADGAIDDAVHTRLGVHLAAQCAL